MFSEEVVKSLPEDKLEASLRICDYFKTNNLRLSADSKLNSYDEYLSALAFAEVFIAANSLKIDVPKLNHRSAPPYNLKIIVDFFDAWSKTATQELITQRKTNKYESAKQQYAHMLGKVFMYEFSDDDFKKIQQLLNNLRELLEKSTDFEEQHRLRLLKKLEALQLELHKKMSSFDRFWGFCIDSSIAFRKFWKNSEPFIKDVKEVMEIVCRTQAKAENIKSLPPLNLLTDGDKENE